MSKTRKGLKKHLRKKQKKKRRQSLCGISSENSTQRQS